MYYSNRAACNLFLKNYQQVVADCNEALAIKPQYAKALTRRAQAYENLGRRREAMVDHMSVAFISSFQDEAADKVGDAWTRKN